MDKPKRPAARQSSPPRPSRFAAGDKEALATSKFFRNRASEAGGAREQEGKLLARSNQMLSEQLAEQKAANSRLKASIAELLRGNAEREAQIGGLSRRVDAMEACHADTEQRGRTVLVSIARARKTVQRLSGCLAPSSPAPAQLAQLEGRRGELRAELDRWNQRRREQAARLRQMEAEDCLRRGRIAQLREERAQLTLLLQKFVQLKTSFTEKMSERAKALLVENQRIDLLDQYASETLRLCRAAEP